MYGDTLYSRMALFWIVFRECAQFEGDKKMNNTRFSSLTHQRTGVIHS